MDPASGTCIKVNSSFCERLLKSGRFFCRWVGVQLFVDGGGRRRVLVETRFSCQIDEMTLQAKDTATLVLAVVLLRITESKVYFRTAYWLITAACFSHWLCWHTAPPQRLHRLSHDSDDKTIRIVTLAICISCQYLGFSSRAMQHDCGIYNCSGISRPSATL